MLVRRDSWMLLKGTPFSKYIFMRCIAGQENRIHLSSKHRFYEREDISYARWIVRQFIMITETMNKVDSTEMSAYLKDNENFGEFESRHLLSLRIGGSQRFGWFWAGEHYLSNAALFRFARRWRRKLSVSGIGGQSLPSSLMRHSTRQSTQCIFSANGANCRCCDDSHNYHSSIHGHLLLLVGSTMKDHLLISPLLQILLATTTWAPFTFCGRTYATLDRKTKVNSATLTVRQSLQPR